MAEPSNARQGIETAGRASIKQSRLLAAFIPLRIIRCSLLFRGSELDASFAFDLFLGQHATLPNRSNSLGYVLSGT